MWLPKLRAEDKSFWSILGFTVIIYFVFLCFLGSLFPSFLTEFTAGVLGILIGFGLDRRIDAWKNERDKKDLLSDLRNELEEIKDKLKGVHLLYPDIWDSAISSGQIRLLNSEQVRKLASVYRYIKETDYEVLRLRDAEEDSKRKPTSSTLNRYLMLLYAYKSRRETCRKRIDEILQEKWWGSKVKN